MRTVPFLSFTPQPRSDIVMSMRIRYVYWQQGEHWLGYLEEFPDYWTQGESLDDLKQHLLDVYDDLVHDRIPGVRRVAELEVG